VKSFIRLGFRKPATEDSPAIGYGLNTIETELLSFDNSQYVYGALRSQFTTPGELSGNGAMASKPAIA
jgi:hypothetical protein